VYCPWAIRENPASSAANQIARFIKTNACHIIKKDIALVVPILKNVQSFKKVYRRKIAEKFGFNFGNFY
jgi:hypothetical protein